MVPSLLDGTTESRNTQAGVSLLRIAVAEVVLNDDGRLGNGRQNVLVVRPEAVARSASGRCWRLRYRCWVRNLISIRRGSQRRLGRLSADIAARLKLTRWCR